MIRRADNLGALDGEATLASEPQPCIAEFERHDAPAPGRGLNNFEQCPGLADGAAAPAVDHREERLALRDRGRDGRCATAQIPDLHDRRLLAAILLEQETAGHYEMDVPALGPDFRNPPFHPQPHALAFGKRAAG